ncbi:hypothetical protein [Halomonas cerina]|uniref:DUF4136 domain-containing protein n=1 Tax=Halomonas cerina TaxID=447424 RepID=A0A839VDS9_9GAMM|nr:hypothetical protein [Halomonas cerina]MBB3192288.1 hypothetical protein [Halomonas cerina]
MRAWILVIVLMWLAGCQATPSTLPQAEPLPAEACHWPAPEAARNVTLDAVASALEEEGFLIRHTDTGLGLVSAERSQRTFYHYHGIDPWPRLGGFVLGGRGHVASGVMLGIGTGIGPVTDEATRVERVSVMVGEQTLQVTRDLRLFGWRGDLVESRTASDADFCQRLHTAIRLQLAGEVAR